MDFFIICFLIYAVLTALSYYIKFKYRHLFEEQIIEKSSESDWLVPLYIEHTKDKTMFYAWDISGQFIAQHKCKDDLLTIVSERYNIPKDKLFIESFKPL